MANSEFGRFLAGVHGAPAWKNLGEKIRQGQLVDNTAAVKAENDRTITTLLDDIDFHYGYEPIFQHPDTRMALLSKGLTVAFRPELFYTEKDGKIRATGVCHTEAFVKANLINASTTHSGELAVPISYDLSPDETHVRVELVRNALASPLPLEKIDSSRMYRAFHINGARATQRKLDDSGLLFANEIAFLHLPGEVKSIEVNHTPQGEIREINRFAAWGSTVADSEDGDISVTSMVTGRYGFIGVMKRKASSSWIVIDKNSPGSKIIDCYSGESPDPDCQKIAEMIQARLVT